MKNDKKFYSEKKIKESNFSKKEFLKNSCLKIIVFKCIKSKRFLFRNERNFIKHQAIL